MKISDLKTLDPNTPWLQYINTLLSKEIVQVTEDETIIVGAPSYLENMSKLIAATPARVAAAVGSPAGCGNSRRARRSRGP